MRRVGLLDVDGAMGVKKQVTISADRELVDVFSDLNGEFGEVGEQWLLRWRHLRRIEALETKLYRRCNG